MPSLINSNAEMKRNNRTLNLSLKNRGDAMRKEKIFWQQFRRHTSLSFACFSLCASNKSGFISIDICPFFFLGVVYVLFKRFFVLIILSHFGLYNEKQNNNVLI
jgi:hypothetical protein